MISVTDLRVDGKSVLGVKVDLPGSPPLLVLEGEKGFVMCGFLNVDVAERLNIAAAMVSGVKTFDDVLNAEVKAATSKAKDLGINVGMKGAEALKHF